MVASVQTAAVAQTPGYHFPGLSPGATTSNATALSADGRVVAGWTNGASSMAPFIWSEGAGRYDVVSETVSGSVLSPPAAISGDGTTLVGRRGNGEAYRWRGLGTYQVLGFLGQHGQTAATGVSGDGAIVVGRATSFQSSFGEAWRWTQATGMQGLGFTRAGHISSEANGISRDGNVIVGTSRSASGDTDAFAWTAATGMRILPLLSGADSGEASGTNSNGSLIVGYAYDAIGLRTAAMWTLDSLQLLTAPSGWRSWATDLSDDGSVVLGTLSTNNTGPLPAIWTPAAGWLFAADYFASQGFPVPAGWTVRTLDALSADGRTFAGRYSIGNNLSQAFVLTVPTPTPIALAGALLVFNARRRRSDKTPMTRS